MTRLAKANKLLVNFFFHCNNVRLFEVFKSTAGCIFKSEKTKMKLVKKMKKWIFKQKPF